MLVPPSTKQAGNTKDQEPLEEVKIQNRQDRSLATSANGNTTVPRVESLETLRMMVMQESVFFFPPHVFLRDESAALSITFLLPGLSEPSQNFLVASDQREVAGDPRAAQVHHQIKKKYLYPKMTQDAGLRFYIITFPTQACVLHLFEPNFFFFFSPDLE